MLKFSLANRNLITPQMDGLLVAVRAHAGKAFLSPSARAVDDTLDGLLSAVCKRENFTADSGASLSTHARGGKLRIVLLGLGAGNIGDCTDAIIAAVSNIKNTKILGVVAPDDAASADISAFAAAVSAGCYQYRLGGAQPVVPSLKEVRFTAAKATKHSLARAAAVGEGACLARHLAEQPANVCTPKFLAQTATAMGKKNNLRIKILDEKKMRQLKMEALLSVAQGSREPPRLIIMEHRGGSGAPVALVGKGVTFDSGGLSLKPATAMEEMKFDMCGAASVFGTLLACAKMKLPLNVVGIVPTCENMPDGKALKPGDVITAMNGKTIEVLNTDAEGRLILADALTYVARYKPAAIIDIATLTGACVIALGHHISGLLSNSDHLAEELARAGQAAGDLCWRLPMGDKYTHQLKSSYADLANIGGRDGGTITAAAFLSHFTESPQWAHLDIAGTAWNKRRATGRPTFLLTEFLARRAGIVK